ncbi:helix-turn-helix domain-containing protein [Dyadobacter sp. NIV53]|uniref:winged helix-turn-helix transcriptional regulator n=1 Tax=Dyadobacter sp. NIV53 TaxID=2861765 RepID=UPI001C884367|nr:helix-turn-helix domain-containing protein [Dyadobacter sp. NIV53]
MLFDTNTCDPEQSRQRTLALRDAIELLSGKWKFCILLNLYQYKIMRFKDLQETSIGITPKVLSKELQELEENLLITRTVNNTKPVTVSYALTDHAIETQPVINALIEFGLKHRKKIKDE